MELANPDLNSRFWGRVIIPNTGEPWLDLHGRYHDVKVSQARHYLPVAVIPPKGVAWLDQALVSGRVVAGEMTFRGPPSAFPFDRNEGLFETRFQVEDAVLDYGPGWPRLERLKTEVLFRNRGLLVEAHQGRLLDGEMEQATARIDDLVRSGGASQGARQRASRQPVAGAQRKSIWAGNSAMICRIYRRPASAPWTSN